MVALFNQGKIKSSYHPNEIEIIKSRLNSIHGTEKYSVNDVECFLSDGVIVSYLNNDGEIEAFIIITASRSLDSYNLDRSKLDYYLKEIYLPEVKNKNDYLIELVKYCNNYFKKSLNFSKLNSKTRDYILKSIS